MPRGGQSADLSLLLTCEHGGNLVPTGLRANFKDADQVLQGHRGWDPGALDLYRTLLPIADEGFSSTISRLVIELNRSLDHPDLFSKYTRDLSEGERRAVQDTYYSPFREAVLDTVRQWLKEGREVLHVSVHSFTPELEGERRDFHIGLLFDPGHGREASYAAQWRAAIRAESPSLDVRFNEPYLGTDDGHTLALRKACGAGYAGMELEVRNDLLSSAAHIKEIGGPLLASLGRMLGRDLPA